MSGLPRAFWIRRSSPLGLRSAACAKQTLDAGPPKPVIAVSIFPVASLVGQLTDGWADVVTLLPDGASEHAFEMTADQVRQLSRADLLVLVGNGLGRLGGAETRHDCRLQAADRLAHGRSHRQPRRGKRSHAAGCDSKRRIRPKAKSIRQLNGASGRQAPPIAAPPVADP